MKTTPVSILNNNLPHYIVVIVVFVVGLFYYYRFQNDFDCGDLGLKIAGAKLQTQHSNAYLYIKPNGDTTINCVISTPLLNTLHTPLITLNSCQVKSFSFWFNFTLLFLCLFFATQLAISAFWPRLYILAAALTIFFVFAKPFMYNLVYGQLYLVFALLFFLLLNLLKKKQHLLLGIVWSFAIAIRPTFLAGGLFALLYFNRKVIFGLFTGAIIILLFTVATGTISYWKEYSAAMKIYANQLPVRYGVAGVVFDDIHTASPSSSFSDCTGILSPEKRLQLRISRPGAILLPLQYWLIMKHKIITNTTFYSAVAAILCLIVAICTRIRFKVLCPEKYVLAVFILYFICELCISAPRGLYSFVIWFFGVALIVANANVAEVSLMILGLMVFYHIPHLNNKFGEIYMIFACLMFLFRKNKTPYYTKWFKRLAHLMHIGTANGN